MRRESADDDYFRWIEREWVAGPGQIGQRHDTLTAALDRVNTRVGVYVAQRLRPTDAITVELGLRHDRATAAGDAITSPRLNVSWQPRAGTTVRGAWGRYAQTQSLAQVEIQDGVTAPAPAERSEQRVLGVEQSLPRGVTARVETYDQRVRPRRARYLNVSADVNFFPELEWDRVRVDAESGRARGVELLVARDGLGRVDWSASYALASATDRVAGVDVPRLSDQRHAVNLAWSYHPPSDRWRLSVAALWHSGRPYAPQRTTVDTVANTPETFWIITPQRLAGPLGSERFPGYHRIDARWTRYLDTPRGRVSLFAEVFNLLNTKNVGAYRDNIAWNRQRQVWHVRGQDTMIPRLPTAGIAWEF